MALSQHPIWTLPVDEVFRSLHTAEEGLTDAEAAHRLQQFGPNELPEPPHRPLWLRFADQLKHFMALLLWVAGALAFFAKMPQLGWAIWAVIWINAGFSFWQEYRAEKALAALKQVLPIKVRVRREGELRMIQARELVRGDVIEVEEGDRISADARLIWSESLYLDVSVITGESVPVLRTAEMIERPQSLPLRAGKVIQHVGEHPLHEKVHPSEVANLLLAGTSVAAGRGVAVVYATGAQTEFGHIARLTTSVKREPSSLEVQVARIVRIISTIAVLMGVIVFFLSYLLIGMSATASFIFAIGIIVANVPEGLLPTVTLALAISVQRMAKQNALVRRLSAVEALSATTVICTDKTGTLTRNEMTVRYIWIPHASEDAKTKAAGSDTDARAPLKIEVTGAGFDPTSGELKFPPSLPNRWNADLLLAGAALCSNAQLLRSVGGTGDGDDSSNPDDKGDLIDRSNSGWNEIGDPTEAALLVVAKKAGLDLDELKRLYPRTREVPFDSNRRMMTVVVDQSAKPLWPLSENTEHPSFLTITKGAPLEVLKHCRTILRDSEISELDAKLRSMVASENDLFAKDALRVIGVAAKIGGQELPGRSNQELEQDLTFIGLIAMHDPPRPEVAGAVKKCHAAGIKVSMVTGDYGLTAEAIADSIGLLNGPARIVTGENLSHMTSAQLHQLLKYRSNLVFARMSPEHKLRLVSAYKEIGEVVAVTGDGVNDAPALRAAHIGIAMGIKGTDVARESADIVLADDNFASIVSAVEQGRSVYNNIRKFMTYILSSNIPEIVPFLSMVALKVPPALSIMQILAVDLVTDMAPAVALGAEAPEGGVMRTPPRKKHEYLLNRRLLVRAYLFLGAIEAVFAMAAFFLVWGLHGYGLTDIQAVAPEVLAGTAEPSVMAIFLQSTTITLIAIVACQVGNVFACRSEEASILQTIKSPNRLLFYGIITELAAIALIIFVPVLNRIFSTSLPPLELIYLLPLCPILLVGADELGKFIGRRSSMLRK